MEPSKENAIVTMRKYVFEIIRITTDLKHLDSINFYLSEIIYIVVLHVLSTKLNIWNSVLYVFIVTIITFACQKEV